MCFSSHIQCFRGWFLWCLCIFMAKDQEPQGWRNRLRTEEAPPSCWGPSIQLPARHFAVTTATRPRIWQPSHPHPLHANRPRLPQTQDFCGNRSHWRTFFTILRPHKRTYGGVTPSSGPWPHPPPLYVLSISYHSHVVLAARSFAEILLDADDLLARPGLLW